ncbi:MAG: hypothetical protein AB1589_31885 [Cyanobacteriota bacterium]
MQFQDEQKTDAIAFIIAAIIYIIFSVSRKNLSWILIEPSLIISSSELSDRDHGSQ